MTEHPLTPFLTPFLRARYDEREKVARAASAAPWSVGGVAEDIGSADVVSPDGAVTSAHAEPCCSIEDAEHIALNDPAFVLADIAAKRKIVELYERAVTVPTSRLSSFVRGQDDGFRQACIEALKLLAEPYLSHPDYPKDV